MGENFQGYRFMGLPFPLPLHFGHKVLGKDSGRCEPFCSLSFQLGTLGMRSMGLSSSKTASGLVVSQHIASNLLNEARCPSFCLSICPLLSLSGYFTSALKSSNLWNAPHPLLEESLPPTTCPHLGAGECS